MEVYGTYICNYLVLTEIIVLGHKIQYPKIMVFHTFLEGPLYLIDGGFMRATALPPCNLKG